MTTKRQNSFRGIGGQIWSMLHLRSSNTLQEDPKTWAQIVKSHHDLPEMYEHFFLSHLSRGDAFPYAVLTPSYEKFGSTISGKLICIFAEALHVLDESAAKLIDVCYPIDKIHYVEVSSKLLEFRVTINGVTDHGDQTSSVFRCSTVTDHLFTPILDRIRLRDASLSESVQPVETQTFDHWSERNFKFMNLARHCLLRGESVIVAVLQPEIHSGSFSFSVRRFRKVKSPTHACILTEKELILVREDLLQRRKDKYGSTRTFIPLDKIHSLSMSRRTDNLLVVFIQLINQDCFECLFDTNLEAEVDELITRASERISGEHTRLPA